MQAKLSVHLERKCGIATADFGLVKLASGELAYITKRMDREDGIKHMIDMCQLAEKMTERKYYGSYELVGKKIRQYSSFGGADISTLLDLVLFSFITGNSDMHLKNFSLIREHNGTWHLSPAYDAATEGLSSVQFDRELARITTGIERNIEAALEESFLSDDFKSRVRDFITDRLPLLNQ